MHNVENSSDFLKYNFEYIYISLGPVKEQMAIVATYFLYDILGAVQLIQSLRILSDIS